LREAKVLEYSGGGVIQTWDPAEIGIVPEDGAKYRVE
jgi:hypothetical protein